MAMKTHPLLSGCLITALVVFFFLGVTVLAYSFLGKDRLLASRDKVGVVEIKGVLVDGKSTLKQLDRFRDDNSIKAIVLRIDSPGGRWARPRKSCGRSRKSDSRRRSWPPWGR